jgi:suppressor of ftsI
MADDYYSKKSLITNRRARLGRKEGAMISYRTSNTRRCWLTCSMGLAMIGGMPLTAPFVNAQSLVASQPLLSSPPEARSPIVLTAINDPQSGKAAFSFNGREDPPVIRAVPGEDIRLTYINAMSTASHERCIDGPCMNMTNLHFHGLHVSPDSPQDDVIGMMATPGQSLQYVVNIPPEQPPGLYWYHTHAHGESYQQDLDGMSGAIVIDGIERYVPELQHMRARILVLRDRVIGKDDSASPELMRTVELSRHSCSASSDVPERIFTVNGAVRPQIPIAAGERQFWRIVNASPDLYADLQVDGEQLEIVALDGMPLGFHDPEHPLERVSHILVPPAGRVEAIITGPRREARASLRSLCFDTGRDGDPNPAMVLADLVNIAEPIPKRQAIHVDSRPPASKPLSPAMIARVENSSPDFVVHFSEDKKGFYINGRKYSPSDPPMTSVSIGAFHHWRVTNDTFEVHPFHIHQVHFLIYAENGVPLKNPEWLDTVNVPVEGNVDLMMDFTDPIIRGVSLFHCHLLSHEDKGMMAKILFK